MRRRLAVAAVTALAITGLAACGSEESDEPGGSGSAGGSASTELAQSVDGLSVTGDFGKEPKVEVDGLDVDEAQAALVIEGDGEELTAEGAAMTSIFLAKGADGSTLQSSFGQDPFKMVVSQVNTEIREALTGQAIGSRIALAAPAEDLYGPNAAQLGLTAEDDVILVIDLVEAAEAPAPALDGPEGEPVEPPADAPKVVEEDGEVTGIDFSGAPAKAPTKLQVIPLIEGEGEAVTADATITADYFGVVWGAKEKFDDSFSRGEPLQMPLSGLVPGWGQGLEGVKVGSRVLLVIPPELGYGDQESGSIPPNSTLVFVVDVLGVS